MFRGHDQAGSIPFVDQPHPLATAAGRFRCGPACDDKTARAQPTYSQRHTQGKAGSASVSLLACSGSTKGGTPSAALYWVHDE